RTAHEHTDCETESDDSGQYPVYRLPGLHGGMQIVERPAGRPRRVLCWRRLSEPARSRRQQLHAHYLQRGRYRRQARLGVRAPAMHALRTPSLRLRVPDHGDVQNGSRSRGVRRIALHRLPGVHAGLPVHYSQIRLRQLRAEDPQMQVLRRPFGSRAGTGMRGRVPHGRDQLRRPRRHGYRSEAADRGSTRHLHPGDLRARGSRRYQRAAPFVSAVRTDRLHYRTAEDADARPHAQMAARHGTRVRRIVRDIRRAELDRAPAHAPPRARRRAHMNWRIRLTWWDKSLLAIMAVCRGLAPVRFATGIGTIANINNAYPWGWWVGYGIMTMIALGAVGFTITALVEVLGVHRYHPFLRPAVLMGLLCYTSAITMLMVELGRPWMVWMVLISWAPTSALFEVGWCAFLYLTVLALEFAQVPVEQLGWGRALRILRAIYIPIMLLGVTLSHLHQSSLGTLMALIPHKVNVLWWSDLLPLIFLFSAIMAGPAMAILEHLAAARWLGF